MKKLLVVSTFVVLPLLSTNAMAEGCRYGQHAQYDNQKELNAEGLDPALLALLQKKKEEEVLEAPEITYN